MRASPDQKSCRRGSHNDVSASPGARHYRIKLSQLPALSKANDKMKFLPSEIQIKDTCSESCTITYGLVSSWTLATNPSTTPSLFSLFSSVTPGAGAGSVSSAPVTSDLPTAGVNEAAGGSVSK